MEGDEDGARNSLSDFLEKVEKYFFYFLILATVSLLLYTYGLHSRIDQLQTQINLRDSIILDVKSRDSLFVLKTKNYAEIISQYDSNCFLIIDKSKISNKDLIAITVNSINERASLKDSIHFVMDENETILKLTNSYFEAVNSFDNEKLSNLLASTLDAFFLLEITSKEKAIEEFKRGQKIFPDSYCKYDLAQTVIKRLENGGYQVLIPIKYAQTKDDTLKDIIYLIKFDSEKKITFLRNYFFRDDLMKKLSGN